MGRPEPSELQLRVLQFVHEDTSRTGLAPSVAEIRDALEISSKSVVAFHLNVLANFGLIRRLPQVSRGLLVTDAGLRKLGIVDPRDVVVRTVESFLGGEATRDDLRQAVEACEVAA